MTPLRVVAAAVIDRAGLLLVSKRSAPTVFYLPGGKPEPDEEPLACLRRELSEELNSRLAWSRHFCEFQSRAALEDAEMTLSVYLARLSRPPRRGGEIAALTYWSPETRVRLAPAVAERVIPQLQATGLLPRGVVLDPAKSRRCARDVQRCSRTAACGPIPRSEMRGELAGNEWHPGHTINSIVLARQPIFDRRDSVVGYALRYRPLAPSGQLAGPETSIASVMVGALAEIGLEKLVGDRPAHIAVTPQFLHYVGQLPLPPERVVLELAATPDVDADLLPALHDVIKAGFQIAIVGVIPAGAGEAMWRLASAVKLDSRALAGGGDEVNDLLTGLRRRGLRLIADRVETPEQYEAMRALHFDAYQGQYFATPRSIREVVAPTHRLGALVSLTHGAAGASLEDLERHICEDPGLSYRFVRLANSAFYGGRTPVGSIRQALMRLGAAAVSQWIMLFALSKMTDQPQHLLNTAVHRARLCEMLAREYPDAVPERAFSAGLFSVLDSLLGRPMPELIADLCLDDRLATAITDHRGPEGRLLAAVMAYERGDFAACAQHDVRLVDVANAYWHAAGWADYATAMVA